MRLVLGRQWYNRLLAVGKTWVDCTRGIVVDPVGVAVRADPIIVLALAVPKYHYNGLVGWIEIIVILMGNLINQSCSRNAETL